MAKTTNDFGTVEKKSDFDDIFGDEKADEKPKFTRSRSRRSNSRIVGGTSGAKTPKVQNYQVNKTSLAPRHMSWR